MSLIEPAASRTLDPLQSVLAHLPDGMYGTYEGLCNFMLIDPGVPPHVKEGLRYLSAVTIGCAFCREFRESDPDGRRLLPDAFYAEVAAGAPDWDELVGAEWSPLFVAAAEVLADEQISDATMARLRGALTDAQIVTALFYMLVIGASHRLSHALGVEAECRVPAQLLSAAEAAAQRA
jgi:hypothetical protein